MGVLISGKAQVDHEEMLRCCWPAYLTVMYDAEKVGLVKAESVKENNDYALWLNISVKHVCHLLPTTRCLYIRACALGLIIHSFLWRRERIKETSTPSKFDFVFLCRDSAVSERAHAALAAPSVPPIWGGCNRSSCRSYILASLR